MNSEKVVEEASEFGKELLRQSSALFLAIIVIFGLGFAIYTLAGNRLVITDKEYLEQTTKAMETIAASTKNQAAFVSALVAEQKRTGDLLSSLILKQGETTLAIQELLKVPPYELKNEVLKNRDEIIRNREQLRLQGSPNGH